MGVKNFPISSDESADDRNPKTIAVSLSNCSWLRAFSAFMSCRLNIRLSDEYNFWFEGNLGHS